MTRTPTATRTPRVLPALTGLTPKSADRGGDAFTLTVNGIGIANGAIVRWNGEALATTFISTTELTAAVPAARLSAVNVAQITVQNPNGNVSDAVAFFVTENGAMVISSDAATNADPGGTVIVAAGGAQNVVAAAQGAGTIAVAQYNANQGGALPFTGASAYMDVNLSSGNAFTEVVMEFGGLGSGSQIHWWNGSAWGLASQQSYIASSNCVIVTVNQTTSPSLSELTGTYFIGAVGPTAVSLAAFTADRLADGVILRWLTAAEVDVVGFNLYRAASAAGPYTRLNADLIPAQGDAMTGASYDYLDTPGFGVFYYQLEDVEIGGGITRHGPISAQSGATRRLYLPLITR